jgi:ABC-2 type transport system permease protein
MTVVDDLEVPSERVVDAPLAPPGRGGGLIEVARRRYLLRLLVRRELRARYQGSLLGLGWSYVRPAVNFGVYYLVLGVFLKLSKVIPDYPIYIFAGLVPISFFTETFITSAWSVVGNAPLVQKIYLPREMFPAASLLVSAVHMVPAFAILIVTSAFDGWHPSMLAVGSAVLAIAIVFTLGMAAGLLVSSLNVLFRDMGQVVDILNIVIPWSVPMMYYWTSVRAATGTGPLLQLYLANPLGSAISLFQRAFWWPSLDPTGPYPDDQTIFPSHLTERGLISLGGAIVLLGVAQLIFMRIQRRFAQEL